MSDSSYDSDSDCEIEDTEEKVSSLNASDVSDSTKRYKENLDGRQTQYNQRQTHRSLFHPYSDHFNTNPTVVSGPQLIEEPHFRHGPQTNGSPQFSRFDPQFGQGPKVNRSSHAYHALKSPQGSQVSKGHEASQAIHDHVQVTSNAQLFPGGPSDLQHNNSGNPGYNNPGGQQHSNTHSFSANSGARPKTQQLRIPSQNSGRYAGRRDGPTDRPRPGRGQLYEKDGNGPVSFNPHLHTKPVERRQFPQMSSSPNLPMGSNRGPKIHSGNSEHVAYRKLEEWSCVTNNTLLVFDMNSHLEGLSKLLNHDYLKFDAVRWLLIVLKKIISVHQSQKASLQFVLKCVCQSKFLDVHLTTFFHELEKKRNTPDVYGYFQKIVDVLDFVRNNMKDFLPSCGPPLQQLLETGRRLNILTEDNELSLRIQQLLRQSATAYRPGQHTFHPKASVNSEPRRRRMRGTAPALDEATPPDDYKKMTIFPDKEELDVAVEPFLRANKTRGAYRNLQHYLDIHARLMKEDYLAPIRIGLKDFKSACLNQSKVKEDDLRFYYNVQVVKINESEQGISHLVTFDIKQLEHNIDWEFSRRLMFGSLLVFTKDNFETPVFATVANRDVPKLERGVLEVVFQNNLEEIFTSSEHDTFIMAETTAYFESYRPVLEGLQEMEEIPLERYILYCMREIQPPQYLQSDTRYNIACVMNHVYDDYPVPVLDGDQWPDAEKTSLNDAQLEALKLALSNEMAVIQGPPGTGKTYVGLKIMKILLENRVTKQSGKKGPILVVCFTNHALDQFLEGMLEFCPDGIVRVGGRSSSTLLEKFNLKELRQNPSLSRKIKENIRLNLKQCRQELKKVSKIIDRFWQESQRMETTILTLDDLSEEIDEVHRDSLTDPRRQTSLYTTSTSSIMSTWLKALNANMDNHLAVATKRHLAKVIATGTDILNDSVLTDKKAAGKTTFRSRVQIYHYWLTKYKTNIESDIELLVNSDAVDRNSRLQRLIEAQEEANKSILQDKTLKPHVSEKAFKSVMECVKSESRNVEENTYIQSWLLSQFTTTDQLLDAVEQLTVQNTGTKQPSGRGRVMADSEASARGKRWVIDDSEESGEESSDDSYEDDDVDSDGKSNEMDDVDEGGMVNLTEIRELEESFKQFFNKEFTMLQRAKLLGIDLTETSDTSQEWQTVGSSMSYGKVFKLLHNTVPFSEEEVADITDVWSLQLRDRYRLYKYWVEERKHKLINRLIDLTTLYKLTLQRKKEALAFKDSIILKRARVIGMTTTGAAKHRALLQQVGCRIIVVEEAAEVLEAHIVTTLNKNCQHLILIGDHQQLRPNPTVHRLAVDYDLEISLFERLVKNNVPHVTLTKQHRMRPEISIYLQLIYPRLDDHFSVLRYENIEGVDSNIFFLHHTFEEREVEDSTSKANVHEARFLTGLCKYFLQHGYQGKQVTVLAAYGGQVKAIKEEMEKEEDVYGFVRVTSIDNYQGEENDIVLLSLVRSNEAQDVGFLKTDNRVCVALSRAKKGLFVIGNLELLASKSELWRNIVFAAQAQHVTGMHMKLVCVNHAHHVTYVSNPEDFQREVPEGGCHRQCDAQLPCGHSCTRLCHASDRFHENTKCMQPCMKKCPEGHLCQKDCYQECGLCEVRVTKHLPICGHQDQVPCYQDVDDAICSQSCGERLPCGHICRGQCGTCRENEYHQPCLEKVDRTWPCGHSSQVECRIDTSIDPCPAKCKERLECGHKCKGTCGECLAGRVHRPCGEECKKPLPCGHPCAGLCGEQCMPCKLRCLTSCRHTSCSRKTCGEVCDLCTENCAMVCQHKYCSMRCMDECQAQPCSKSCSRPVSKCKHKCWSLCGEECVCYNCEQSKFSLIDSSNKKKPKHYIEHEKNERAKKFDVGKDTVLMKIPRCGHIFTLKQLDRHVENFEPSSTTFIRCPSCKTPIQGISRYEVLNKRRAGRRENLKKDLWESARVSDTRLEGLRQSMDIVTDFCRVDDGEFLSRKPDQIDSNHAMAINMQIRFAHVLSRIDNIHQDFNEGNEFRVDKWKRIITSLQRHVTDQFCHELTLELKRLLLLEQAVALNKLTRDIDSSQQEEVQESCRTLLKALRKQKLTDEDKGKLQAKVAALYRIFDDHDSDVNVQVTDLEERVKATERILDVSRTEDLYSILLQN